MFAAVRTSHVCCCFVTVLPHSFFTYHSSPLAYYHLSPTAPLWIVSLIWFSHFLPFPFRGICCSHHTGCSPTLPRRPWWEVQIYPVCGTNASESVTIHRIQNWRNESLTNVFCCVCPIPMWTSCTLPSIWSDGRRFREVFHVSTWRDFESILNLNFQIWFEFIQKAFMFHLNQAGNWLCGKNMSTL